MPQKAIIIGAGPAGLTAAYELLHRTDIIPVILEKSDIVGGISRTIDYNGNRMDMGPHRFFSKSDRVMDWWLNIMPLQEGTGKTTNISYQNKTRNVVGDNWVSPGPEKVMLVISRLTRIYFLHKFFSYPIKLSIQTLKTLGFTRTIKIMLSFLWIRIFPRKPEKSLEDFIINKFGKTLYQLFFKDYTEKVWGIAPSQISAEWGAQRIKGVSLSKAIAEAVKSLAASKKSKPGISQKETETSLIEQFLYPKHGPGSLWEEVAHQIKEKGGQIYLNQDVKKIDVDAGRVTAVATFNNQNGETFTWEGEYFFSTMPVKELIADVTPKPPADVRETAEGLQYRDFINVGVLLKQLSTQKGNRLELKDNWIYIQEKDVKVGRIMIYNNWGDGMVKDPDTTWIGMEYFCNNTDELWAMDDIDIQALAIRELGQMDLARKEDVLDCTVRRMEKTYPAYFGTYNRFDTIKEFVNQFENLFLIGRNGMHKYNNADHSMLCAMVAVDNINAGIKTKDNLWAINTEQEYHEQKTASPAPDISSSHIRHESFPGFTLQNKFIRSLLLISSLSAIIQFTLFKLLYPNAGFINGDSYAYLQTAFYNASVATYPIGYSKFLRLFSVFTTSDTMLVAFQYLFLQATIIFFIISLIYFLKPGKFVRSMLALFSIANPLLLYLCNYVSSDSIFTGLSILWFTLLIWIIHQPTKRLLIVQSAILLLAFTVRYNALYYPLVTAIAILLTNLKASLKTAAIVLNFLVIGVFVFYTSNEYKAQIGVREFSPFSGWQIANNAMYGYRFVPNDKHRVVPSKFKELDRVVRAYYDTTADISNTPQELLVANTYFMWDPRSPLQSYMKSSWKADSSKNVFEIWAGMGPLYSQYGTYLIRTYPLSFFKYYLWPNFIKYYSPPAEFLNQYNMGRDTVSNIARGWFGYKSKYVKARNKDYLIITVDGYPVFDGIVNVVFIFSIIAFILLNGLKASNDVLKILGITFTFWVVNLCFSVFASPVTLRYQIFPMLIAFAGDIILIEYIRRIAFGFRDPPPGSMLNTQTSSRVGLEAAIN